MKNLSDIEIVVPGNLYAPTLAQLERIFTVHRCKVGKVEQLGQKICQRIRGLATMSGIKRAGIEALPSLEMISNFGVGYDAVDVGCAIEHNIMVSHTPNVLDEEVADTAIGLLINTVRQLPAAEVYLRAGLWQQSGSFPLTRTTLRGRTLGIYGLGRIGKAIARRAEAFGLTIAYFGRNKQDIKYQYHDSLLSLAAAVDTLMIVAPGTPATEKSVNENVMKSLGQDGIIINIGRGGVIDEDALIRCLANQTICAAGLDVFANEPNVPDALLALPNAVLLPHVGSASEATRGAMGGLVVDNLVGWFTDQKPVTPVPEMER